MKLNKIVAVALGVILTSSTALSQVGAADAASKLIGSTKAKEIMLKKVPGAKIVKFRLDNDNTPEYEGELTKGSYKYEIDVNAKSGKVTDYEKETIRTSSSKYIGEAKAKEIMLKKVPGAEIVKFKLDKDDTAEYEGELRKGNYEYEISVNAKTGKITDYEKEIIKTSSSKYIGEAKAKEIMLKKVPGAEIVKFKLDKDDTAEYEGELRKGNYEYEISVNAKTGKITDYEKEIIKTSSKKLIGEAKAKEIMLKKVPGAKIVKFELDNDKTPEYEGELKKGNYEYEITVNAITGKITEFEKDND